MKYIAKYIKKIQGYLYLLLICSLYWISDSVWSYTSFEMNLERMIFIESGSFFDTLLLRVSPYQIVSRLLAICFLIITGIIIIEISIRRKKAEEEKIEAEEKLIQVQKLESIGRLAGGIAHDLNNFLTPIIGYCDLELERTKDENLRDSLNQILEAGIRSRNLIQQLLAFSRKQTLEMEVLNLNQLIRDFRKLLRSTIREDIEIRLELSDQRPMIRGDRGQLEQILINLAVNAEDAMEGGGHLIIKTSEEKGFVVLNIQDSGAGIAPEILEHIFEPFFTTKELNRGTGLGLATVYGIVKQHNGRIKVESHSDMGTVFRILLPSCSDCINGETTKRDSIDDRPRIISEDLYSVLVVEDNQEVRTLINTALYDRGFKVISAVDGEDAARIIKTSGDDIDLVLTDVVMPGVNGRQLIEQISEDNPGIKYIYMSGYSDDVISRHGVSDGNIQVIQKPFSIDELVDRIRIVMEGRPVL